MKKEISRVTTNHVAHLGEESNLWTIKPNTMKDQLLKLISQNRLDEVFSKLNAIGIRPILLQAKYNQLKRDQNYGILLRSDYNAQHQEICKELLELSNQQTPGPNDVGPKSTDEDENTPGPS